MPKVLIELCSELCIVALWFYFGICPVLVYTLYVLMVQSVMCVDYGAIIKAVVPSTSSTSVSMLNISQLKKAFKVISEAALTKGRNDNQLAIEKVNI